MIKTILTGFEPLRLSNFRTYILGQAISLIGTWLQVTAQSWVVWQLTNSEASLGIVAMLNALPTLFLSPWAGVLADRLNRQKLLAFTQAGLMALAAMLAFLVQFGYIQIWHVYLLSTVSGIFGTLEFPTQSAFLGDLAGLVNVRKAVNMNAMFFQASRILGPALAGIVIARLGIATAFWLNSASFLVVIITILSVTAEQRSRPNRGTSIFSDLKEGIIYLSRQPRMQDLLLLSISITALALTLFSMMPAFASKNLNGGAETLGSLMASSGAGALVSVILISPIAQANKNTGKVILAALLWAGVWIVGFSMATSLVMAMFFLFLISFSLPLVIAMSLGLIQVLAPADMRARLLSLFTMISFGLQPISSLLIGAASEHFGVSRVARVNGILLILIAASLGLFRKGLFVWTHDKETAPGSQPASAI